MSVIRRDLFPLLLILGLAAIVRLGHLNALPLTGAEAYAWQQSQRLAPAFVDGPGGHALLVRAGLAAWGAPSEAAIRVGHAAAGVLAVLAAYLLGLSLYSGPAGLLGAALIALGTPFVMASRHASVAAPQLTLLFTTLWLLAPLWNSTRVLSASRVLAAALALGLLVNVGFESWLLLPGLLLSLAVTRPGRLRQGPWWMFCLLALVGLAPWLFWNHLNGNAGWHYLAAQWGAVRPGVPRLTALVDLAGLPVAIAAVAALTGLLRNRNRALVAPGLLFLLAAALWPGDPQGALVCGLGLLMVSLADGLHRWAALRLPREREWFPLRFVVPTLVIVLMGLCAHDAVVQTMAPARGVLVRGASEAIYREASPWIGFPRVRVAPWRHHEPAFEPGPWLALEDGLAAQMSYYMDVPVYGLGAQSRLWGIPVLDQALIVSSPRIDRDQMTWQLRQDFAAVEGPVGRWLHGEKASPYITLWRVSGPRIAPALLLERYAELRHAVLYD